MAYTLQLKNTAHGKICKNIDHPLFVIILAAPQTHSVPYSLVKKMALCIDKERNAAKHRCAFSMHGFHRLLHTKMIQFGFKYENLERFLNCLCIMRSQLPGFRLCGEFDSNEWCCNITEMDSSNMALIESLNHDCMVKAVDVEGEDEEAG